MALDHVVQLDFKPLQVVTESNKQLLLESKEARIYRMFLKLSASLKVTVYVMCKKKKNVKRCVVQGSFNQSALNGFLL